MATFVSLELIPGAFKGLYTNAAGDNLEYTYPFFPLPAKNTAAAINDRTAP